MNMTDIRKIAQKYGIKTNKLNKTTLVRKIQISEDNPECFATASSSECNQPDCLWLKDCVQFDKKNK